MRRLLVFPFLLLMALAMLPSADVYAQDARCFPETGFCISGPIRRYWERNGGLPVFGYPITPLQTERVENWTGPVQWFERDRLEDHSNEGKGILAGRLGVERLALQGRPWQFRPYGGDAPDCRGFRETGYYLCGGFRTYWERNGGLERFGFPVTDQIVERIEGRDYIVQYFERRRMEYHPANRPPFEILLGLLGNEVRGSTTPIPPPPSPTPNPVSQQIRIDEPAENGTISSPVRISGTTARMPAAGFLTYRVSEPNGFELGSGTIPVTRQENGTGRYSIYVAYSAPAGNTVVFELADRDPASGSLIARAQRSARYQPATGQQITIDTPVNGSRVGTRVTVAGRTAIYPSEGDLYLSVTDSRGASLITYPFAIVGTPGQSVTFSTEFTIPDQRGALITIEIRDTNRRGDLLARAQANAFAGSTAYPYPAP
jgi:hypothetical protein